MSLAVMSNRDIINLRQLLDDLADVPPIEISGITCDSREVQPGYVFLAVAGATRHGLEFLGEVIAAGAVAVLFDSSTANRPESDSLVPVIAVNDLAARVGEIADRWFGSPSEDLAISGVTGTNGKTTVAFLLAQSLQLLGQRCAYAGTIGQGIDDVGKGDGLTTASCVSLHRTLAGFTSAGAEHAAIEVSSHALHQHRVDGVRFASGIFTNLSRDHIDYHGDMDAYFAAKRQLFAGHAELPAVINVDDEYGLRLATEFAHRTTAVCSSAEPPAGVASWLRLDSVVADDAGSSVTFDSSWGAGSFRLQIPGRFNVENAALVISELLRRRIDFDAACDVMSALAAPPGRLQHVALDSRQALPAVYVDFAHTPDALSAVLGALRPHCRGEIWCVFGCGGDRDRGKRPRMGAIVSELADHAVVTSDNPRSEDPGQIIEDVVTGIPDGVAAVIEDRAAAIAYVVAQAAADDLVLIAGKGHESEQIIGDTHRPFSDFAIARANLAHRAGVGAS